MSHQQWRRTCPKLLILDFTNHAMKTKYFTLLLLACCLSCNNASEEKTKTAKTDTATMPARGNEFDKTAWMEKDGHVYPHRDAILDNLLDIHILDTLEKEAILSLLGAPDRVDGDYLFYIINQPRMGPLVLHTKTLVIRTMTDTINWIRIHE